MLNIRFAKDYLLHQLTAKTRHGTHSPFVYRLVDKVIYDFADKKVYHDIEEIQRQAVYDGKIKLSVPIKHTRLLYRLVVDLKPKNIVVVGTNTEITESYLQKAADEAQFINLTITEQIDGLNKLDFAFFNIGAQNDPLKYFEHSLHKVHENTMLVFNDIYRTKAIKAAWAAIKANPQVIITIDLFWIGLVFFRKGKIKENFKIKIEPVFLGF